jgi:hypothetical protein
MITPRPIERATTTDVGILGAIRLERRSTLILVIMDAIRDTKAASISVH